MDTLDELNTLWEKIDDALEQARKLEKSGLINKHLNEIVDELVTCRAKTTIIEYYIEDENE